MAASRPLYNAVKVVAYPKAGGVGIFVSQGEDERVGVLPGCLVPCLCVKVRIRMVALGPGSLSPLIAGAERDTALRLTEASDVCRQFKVIVVTGREAPQKLWGQNRLRG